MRFIYNENSGAKSLRVDGEQYVHIFKSRRTKASDELVFCNLKDDNFYLYKISQIDRREAFCELVRTDKAAREKPRNIAIAWAVTDPKTIEKTVPFLNEAGLSKLAFVYMDFSQRNFRIDFKRLERILINSCEQCGRRDLMEFELYQSLDDLLQKYDNIAVLDFCALKTDDLIEPNQMWLVGCEGGFSDKERERLKNFKVAGLKSANILRSESALMAIAAKLLL